MKRYDFASLERLIPGGVSRTLNIGGSAMKTYRRDGMALNTAEKLAERAGFLVYEVWPEALDELIAEVEVECAAPDCPAVFVRKNRGAHRRYCSDNCRDRTNARIRYQRNEAEREARKAKSRQYYAETIEYQRKRSRQNKAAARARRAA